MVYVLTLLLWLNTGDTVALSKTFPTQDACEAARATAAENIESHPDVAAKSGIASYLLTPCAAYSNPATETNP